jgi:hypothetical protein
MPTTCHSGNDEKYLMAPYPTIPDAPATTTFTPTLPALICDGCNIVIMSTVTSTVPTVAIVPPVEFAAGPRFDDLHDVVGFVESQMIDLGVMAARSAADGLLDNRGQPDPRPGRADESTTPVCGGPASM